ncbi:MAG: beta strand repeat-containing protein, partial [Dolichospermum sp.]
MKKVLLIVFSIFFFNLSNLNSQCTSGIYESYAILSINGGANTFYDMQASTANADFNGLNLGTFNNSQSIVIRGGQIKTFKCNGRNITGGNFNYRVYLTSSPSGSYAALSTGFLSNDAGGCGGNQTWQNADGITNVLTGLSSGNYTIEVYSEASYNSCGNGTHFSSNGGSNYKATFNVAPTITVSNSNLAQFTTQNLARNSTNLPISRFQIEVANGGPAVLSSLSFTTPSDGVNSSYTQNDLANFRAYYTTTTTFSTSNLITGLTAQNSGKALTTTGEPITFSGLTQSLSNGTYYIWITADVLSGATAGRTLTVNAPTLTASTGSVSGSSTATGVQTIIAGSPVNYFLQDNPAGTAANWNTLANGSGTTLGSLNTSDVNLIVDNETAATIIGDLTLGSNSKIIVSQGTDAKLTITSGVVTGTIDVGTNGTLEINTASIPTLGTLATGSTVTYGHLGAQNIQNKTYANLTIDGSGTKTLPSALSVNGNLALNAGTLADAGFTLTLGGNITGTGTHSGAGKILMTTASSTISGATLGNLELNNATGFSLTGSPTVNGALALTSGNLSIGNNTLTLGGAVSGSGNLVGSSSSNLAINGTAGTINFAQTTDANRTTLTGTNALQDLTLGNSGSAILGNKVNLFRTLTVGT